MGANRTFLPRLVGWGCWLMVAVPGVGVLQGQSRIAGRIDGARTVELAGHVRPEAQARNDIGPLDSARELERVTLSLRLGEGLEKFLAEQQTPSSPNFHQWLKPEEFADRFGVSREDAGAIGNWLAAQGLRVDEVARGRHWISFSGPAAAMERAFHTELRRYRVNGVEHFANRTNPSIPQALEGVAVGIRGLDDFGWRSNLRSAPKPDYNSGTTHYLSPPDIATIFNLNPLYAQGIDGTGVTIAVLGESEISLTDLHTFRTKFGLTQNDPKQVLVGTTPGTNITLDEADLDLEYAGGLAPKATILYVYSKSVTVALQYAIDQNLANIVTESFGGCEPASNPGVRGVIQQANAQGITVLAASGDQGAASCEGSNRQASLGPTTTFPAAIPEVTAVGGTTLNDATGGPYWSRTNDASNASALGYIPEVAWNDTVAYNAPDSTGGGPSSHFTKPYWQTGPGVPNDNARDLPDISLPSSLLHDGYFFQTSGAAYIAGGTSASTPSMAAILALVNQYLVTSGAIQKPGLGNINPTLYSMAQATTDVFHDITAGDNKVGCVQGSPSCVDGLMGFSAGAGYDLTTGLGSVDAAHLASEWSLGAATTTTVATSASTGTSASSFQLTASVAASAAGGTVPTGLVTFLALNVSLGSATLAGDGTASIAITGSQLNTGADSITAYYSGDGKFASSSGSVTVSIGTASSVGARVVAVVSPNPVHQQGASWPYLLTLRELNGVAATLTSFIVNTTVNPLSSFNSSQIPANGEISASLSVSGLTPPVNRTFSFSGTDATGRTWSTQIVVQFLGPDNSTLQLAPHLVLTTANPTVTPNIASSSCPWAQQLTLQETGGYQVQLTKLTAGTTDLTSRLEAIFGTLRIAPFGMLQGRACLFASATPQTFTITGIAVTTGNSATASVTATAGTAPAKFTALTVPASPVILSVADASKSTSGAVALTVGDGVSAWTAKVAVQGSQTWLTVSPASGAGNASLNLQASAAGLSNGAYFAMLSIQSASAAPQVVQVPVTLVVGASTDVSIAGVANNFSGDPSFAPGEQVAIYGTNLALSSQTVSKTPLLVTAQGTSVTVNGVAAPLYYLAPSQMDVQIPYEVGAGPAVLAVNNNGKVAVFPIAISVAAPGLFPYAIDNSTGAILTNASAGQVLLLFMTGEGEVSPLLNSGATPAATAASFPTPVLPVTVTVGGVAAKVLFGGIAPGLVGVSQIDFIVPDGVPSGPQPVVVTVDGLAANAITLTVQ